MAIIAHGGRPIFIPKLSTYKGSTRCSRTDCCRSLHACTARAAYNIRTRQLQGQDNHFHEGIAMPSWGPESKKVQARARPRVRKSVSRVAASSALEIKDILCGSKDKERERRRGRCHSPSSLYRACLRAAWRERVKRGMRGRDRDTNSAALDQQQGEWTSVLRSFRYRCCSLFLGSCARLARRICARPLRRATQCNFEICMSIRATAIARVRDLNFLLIITVIPL